MIQRIQSLYLLLVAAIYSTLFFVPINEMICTNHILKLSIWGLFEITGNQQELIIEVFPLLIITIISILIALVTLFLYKNRKLQMRLSLYNSILSLGMAFLMLFYVYQISENNHTQIGFSMGLLVPFITFVISILAFRAIRKDELLIRSIDRIR
jgi:uncharacterized membrane protein YidH (DUF202 family)